MGIDAEPDVVGTSAQAAALLLAERLPAGARGARVRGRRACVEALTGARVRAGRRRAGRCGRRRMAPRVRLRAAHARGRRGAARRPFVATNFDPTYPVARWLRARRGCTRRGGATDGFGRDAVVAGKPEAADGRARPPPLGARAAWSWVTGPRPTARSHAALGWPFALVLSGVAGSIGGGTDSRPAAALRRGRLRALAPALVGALGRADAISVEADPLP